MEIELMLLFVSAGNGLVHWLILLFRKQSIRRIALTIYLLAIFLIVFKYINKWEQFLNPSMVLQWILVSATWIMPPMLFFFYKNRKFKELWMHLLTPIFLTLYWFIIQFVTFNIDYQVAGLALAFIKLLFFIIYSILLFNATKASKSDRLFLIPIIACIVCLNIYNVSIQLGFYLLRLDYLIGIVFTIATYALTYYNEFGLVKKIKPKYATSSLSEEDGKHLINQIDNILQDNKFFKDQNFNLTTLSQKLNAPKYRVSQALNSYSNNSFTDLLNKHRIEEAKILLKSRQYDHIKIESIGEDVGFKNKATFYSNFKKVVGQSPGQFRAQSKH